MDPAPSWPHPYVPILQAPLADAAAASSSSGHLVQGLISSSASGRHDWVEHGDSLTQARMNFEFKQQRSDAFDPFLEQAPARSEPSPVQVGGNDHCPPPYRRRSRMGPPCADSNAALPVTRAMAMAMAMDQWTSTATGNGPIATAVELPSTRQSSGSILAFHNMSKLSMPDVQLKALSRSETQIHPPSGRKPAETRDESSPATLILKSPSDAPFESEDGGSGGVPKRSKVAAEPATTPQQPKTQLMQSQPARSKEKVGERITALQQLVSPFGKTDTASVLSEAIGYIKFLQEQVQVLSSPYIKPGIIRQDVGKVSTTSKGDGEAGSDLRSRGLCLVPVSCTLNVASSNGADYWASGVSGGRR